MSAGAMANKLAAIADELRVQGGGGLRRSLVVGLNAEVKPLIPKVRAAAASRLPQSGGLAARVAQETITVSTSLALTTLGVRMKMPHHDAWATDQGYVRHPYFGRWVEGAASQQLPDARGWWTDTLDEEAPAVLPAMNVIVDRAAQKAFDA